MSRTPRITGLDLIAARAKAGFRVLRVKGSHHFLRHEDGRSTVVPAHAGESLGPGLLHNFSDCQLTAEQLAELRQVPVGRTLGLVVESPVLRHRDRTLLDLRHHQPFEDELADAHPLRDRAPSAAGAGYAQLKERLGLSSACHRCHIMA